MTNSENYQTIKDYANHLMYSDIAPYEVVEIRTPRLVYIRAMDAELIKRPTDFRPGGFAGHYADNYSQKWDIKSNPENPKIAIRWSKAKNRWQDAKGNRYSMADKPCRYYDYNF